MAQILLVWDLDRLNGQTCGEKRKFVGKKLCFSLIQEIIPTEQEENGTKMVKWWFIHEFEVFVLFYSGSSDSCSLMI